MKVNAGKTFCNVLTAWAGVEAAESDGPRYIYKFCLHSYIETNMAGVIYNYVDDDEESQNKTDPRIVQYLCRRAL